MDILARILSDAGELMAQDSLDRDTDHEAKRISKPEVLEDAHG
jgi:hypothetical protein